jgi:hypothetical protein
VVAFLIVEQQLSYKMIQNPCPVCTCKHIIVFTLLAHWQAEADKARASADIAQNRVVAAEAAAAEAAQALAVSVCLC